MKNICEQVALYFYGELAEAQALAFKEHLANCSTCQREMAFLKQMQAALVPPAAPAALVDKVLRKAKPLPWWRRVYKPAVVAVLMCGVGLGVFFGGYFNKTDADTDWLAYVSTDIDAEYNDFVVDFEAFETDFN